MFLFDTGGNCWVEPSDHGNDCLCFKDDTAKRAFDSLVQSTLGDGCIVMFWRDIWIQGYSVRGIAPGSVSCEHASCQQEIFLHEILIDS